MLPHSFASIPLREQRVCHAQVKTEVQPAKVTRKNVHGSLGIQLLWKNPFTKRDLDVTSERLASGSSDDEEGQVVWVNGLPSVWRDATIDGDLRPTLKFKGGGKGGGKTDGATFRLSDVACENIRWRSHIFAAWKHPVPADKETIGDDDEVIKIITNWKDEHVFPSTTWVVRDMLETLLVFGLIVACTLPLLTLVLLYEHVRATQILPDEQPSLFAQVLRPWAFFKRATLWTQALLCCASIFLTLAFVELLLFYSGYDFRGKFALREVNRTRRVVLQYLLAGMLMCGFSLYAGAFASALLWFTLAATLNPTQYLPFAAAAAAFISHVISVVQRAHEAHGSLQTALKEQLVAELQQRCREGIEAREIELFLSQMDAEQMLSEDEDGTAQESQAQPDVSMGNNIQALRRGILNEHLESASRAAQINPLFVRLGISLIRKDDASVWDLLQHSTADVPLAAIYRIVSLATSPLEPKDEGSPSHSTFTNDADAVFSGLEVVNSANVDAMIEFLARVSLPLPDGMISSSLIELQTAMCGFVLELLERLQGATTVPQAPQAPATARKRFARPVVELRERIVALRSLPRNAQVSDSDAMGIVIWEFNEIRKWAREQVTAHSATSPSTDRLVPSSTSTPAPITIQFEPPDPIGGLVTLARTTITCANRFIGVDDRKPHARSASAQDLLKAFRLLVGSRLAKDVARIRQQLLNIPLDVDEPRRQPRLAPPGGEHVEPGVYMIKACDAVGSGEAALLCPKHDALEGWVVVQPGDGRQNQWHVEQGESPGTYRIKTIGRNDGGSQVGWWLSACGNSLELRSEHAAVSPVEWTLSPGSQPGTWRIRAENRVKAGLFAPLDDGRTSHRCTLNENEEFMMDWIFERSSFHVEERLAECEDAIARLATHQTSSSTTRTKLASLTRSMNAFKHLRSLAPSSLLQQALSEASACIEYLQQPRDYLGVFCPPHFVGRTTNVCQ